MESFTTFSAEFEREFERERARRLARYPGLNDVANTGAADRTALLASGLLKKAKLLDRSKVLAVGAKVDDFVRQLRCLGRIRHHRLELEQDSFAEGKTLYLDPATISSEDDLARECSSVTIRDPFINLPESIDLALDPRVIGVATSYFNCMPILSYVKVIKSFTSDFGPADTQFFHRDSGSYWILKAFIYLNDVDTDGGPFCYARTSHRSSRNPEEFGDNIYVRFEDEKVAGMVGAENVVECTGDAGDVWFAETIGMHKGKRPGRTPRRIIIATYCVEKEKGFAYNPIKIRAEDLARLSPVQRAACDELDIVGGGA